MHRLQLQSVVVIQRVPTGQQWRIHCCVCCQSGAQCCCTWVTRHESVTGEGGKKGTGSPAQEVLQLSLCLLPRLRHGPCDTVLKYEPTIMCTLLYSSKWHHDVPGQADSE